MRRGSDSDLPLKEFFMLINLKGFRGQRPMMQATFKKGKKTTTVRTWVERDADGNVQVADALAILGRKIDHHIAENRNWADKLGGAK